jgi:Ca-activated chloride channel family protein
MHVYIAFDMGMVCSMIVQCFGISWKLSLYAYALCLLPLFGFLLFYRYRSIEQIIKMLAGNREAVLFRYTSRGRRIIKIGFLCVGTLFLGIALLQPHWDRDTQAVEQYGRDVFIALDISRSMLAQDVMPSRLEAAKAIIKRLISQLSCERVGLVLFSGSAFIQCPLTEDYGAFNAFLDHADAETISSGSTSLESALKQVLDAYERMPAKKHKIVVILTDGEDFSHNLTAIQARARDMGLTIFAVGIGTAQGAPIPLYDAQGAQIGHQKDSQGNVVVSRHDEKLLRDLVVQSGGYYIDAMRNGNTDDVRSIVDRIVSVAKEKLESHKTWTELKAQYPYFLAVSFACFASEWLL